MKHFLVVNLHVLQLAFLGLFEVKKHQNRKLRSFYINGDETSKKLGWNLCGPKTLLDKIPRLHWDESSVLRKTSYFEIGSYPWKELDKVLLNSRKHNLSLSQFNGLRHQARMCFNKTCFSCNYVCDQFILVDQHS